MGETRYATSEAFIRSLLLQRTLLIEQLQYFDKWCWNGELPRYRGGLWSVPYAEYTQAREELPFREWWFLIAYVCGEPLGAVFLFRDARVPKKATMQGIVKFTPPFLRRRSPSLNDILLPWLLAFARGRGIKKIYVAPVGSEGRILPRYGFAEAPRMYDASVMIEAHRDRYSGGCRFYVVDL